MVSTVNCHPQDIFKVDIKYSVDEMGDDGIQRGKQTTKNEWKVNRRNIYVPARA